MRKVAALVSTSKPMPSPLTSLTTMASAPLREQLGAAVFHAVFCFGGKTDNELAGTAAADDLGQDVFSRREFERERPGALELLLGDADGAVVGHGGGLDDAAWPRSCARARPRASRWPW